MITKSRPLHLSVAAVVALLWAGGSALAQSGEITGRVLDAQGQPFQGVTVRLFAPGEKESQQQASGTDGSFRFERLKTNIYTVNAILDGYSPVTCPGFRLIPGVPRSFEIQMMPAEGEQRSTCKAVDPAAALREDRRLRGPRRSGGCITPQLPSGPRSPGPR